MGKVEERFAQIDRHGSSIGVGVRKVTILSPASFILHTGFTNRVDLSALASVYICRRASYALEDLFGPVKIEWVKKSDPGFFGLIGPRSLNVLVILVEVARCNGGHTGSDSELSCDVGRISRTFVVDPSSCYGGFHCRSEIVDDPLSWGLAVFDAGNKSDLSPQNEYLE